MSQTLIIRGNQVMVGLGTFTFTIPSTGLYTVRLQATELPPSSIVFKVKNNGSDVFTAPVVGQTQSALQFSYQQLYTAADVVTVVSTSAATNDNLLNSIQVNCSIANGF